MSTTAPYPSLIDEQLVDIAAHNVREAFERAERLGFHGEPVEQYAEQVHGGAVLQVLRYREGSRHVER